MEIKITEKKENALLNRTEIYAEIDNSGKPTPTRKEIKEKLSALLSANKDLIVIKKLDQSFGPITKCFAVIYKSAEDLKKTEPEHLLKRDSKKYKSEEKAEKEQEAAKEEQKEGE